MRRKSRFCTLAVLILFGITLVLSGCGGGGGGGGATPVVGGDTGGDTGGGGTGGGGTGGGDTGGATEFSGSTNLSGRISLSGLTSSDAQALSQTAGRRAARALAAVGDAPAAIVKLYVVGPDGKLLDTGIRGSVVRDSDTDELRYRFEGIRDGVDYIVRYVQVVSDGQALELRTTATVTAGQTEVTEDVTPQSTVIAEALVDAVLTATEGAEIEPEVVANIIKSVKDTVQQLVQTGVIQVPSLIVTTGVEVTDAIAAGTGSGAVDTMEDNANLDSTSGRILSSEEVDSELSVAANEAKASSLTVTDNATDAEKRAVLRKIFKELLEDGDIPKFMLQFFGDAFIAGTTVTVGELFDAIGAGIEIDDAWFQTNNITPPNPTRQAAIEAFVAEITHINTVRQKKRNGTALTDTERAYLADVPPVLFSLFPLEERSTWEAITASTVLNVPRGIAFTIYVVDVLIEDYLDDVLTNFNGQVRDKHDLYDFNPMLPGSLMDALGFYAAVAANPGAYEMVDVMDMWLHPGRMWVEGTGGGMGQEVDVLSAGACIMNLGSILAEFGVNAGADASFDLTTAQVSLEYPSANGRHSVSLVLEDPNEVGMMDTCFMIDPWREANPNDGNNSADQWNEPNPARVVSDFTSGTYVVIVKKPGANGFVEVARSSFERTVITGMTNVRPKLVSPAGYPAEPLPGASQAEWDAHWNTMQSFTVTRFSSGAPIEISWKAPTVDLPDGVKMGYHVNVGQSTCEPNGPCNWTHIWSTWDRGRAVFTTSLALPDAVVARLTENVGTNSPYQVNVNAVFIDTANGDHLGEGGQSHADFYVGEPLDLNATFTIFGDVANTTGDTWKAALVQEIYDPNLLFDPYARTLIVTSSVVGGGYELDPAIGDFLEETARGAWFNITVWNDADGDGAIGFDEYQLWPVNGGNLWFNVWGGLLRVESNTCSAAGVCDYFSTVILGGETVEGPAFDYAGDGYMPPPDGSGGSTGGGTDPVCETTMVGDGYCDAACDTSEFNFDGGDCAGGGNGAVCDPAKVGNGICDFACDAPEFNYDGGDCSGGGNYVPVDTDGDGISDQVEQNLLQSGVNDPTSPATLAYSEANLYGTWGFGDPAAGGEWGQAVINANGTYSFTGTYVDPAGTQSTETETGTWLSWPNGGGISITPETHTGPATDVVIGQTEEMSVVFLDTNTVVIDVDGYMQRLP